MWTGSGFQGVLDQTIVKRLWESREDQSVSMAISIHLPELSYLDTLLPVSEHSSSVFFPLSPFLFSLEIEGTGWKNKAIWSIPYPHRIGKRCPGVTCLLIVYLSPTKVSCEPHVQSFPEPRKQRKKGWEARAAKMAACPLPTLPGSSPHTPILLWGPLCIFLCDKLWSLKVGMLPLLSQQRSQKEVDWPCRWPYAEPQPCPSAVGPPHPSSTPGATGVSTTQKQLLSSGALLSSSGLKHMGSIILSRWYILPTLSKSHACLRSLVAENKNVQIH